MGTVFQRSFLLLLGALLTASCSRQGTGTQQSPAGLSNNAPTKALSSAQASVVFEDPGTIAVFHGRDCAQGRVFPIIVIDETLDVPSYATRATVFLNGWTLQYLDDDHNVAMIETAIDTIRLEGTTLKWRASGALAEFQGDRTIGWCHSFTVVAWNPANLDMAVDDADVADPANPFNPVGVRFLEVSSGDFATALLSFSSFLQNQGFAAGKAVAILPRGFQAFWRGACCFPFPEFDHNLAQIGLNFGPSEIIVERKPGPYLTRNGPEVPSLPNSASQVGSGFVSWDTSMVYKDDRDKLLYSFGTMVSGLGGADVGLVQPPLTILPEPAGADAAVGSSLQTKEITVDNVPFEYAIPVMSGWNLRYLEGDKNVGAIGTSIDEFHYRDPADPPGRLRFKISSVLTDNTDPISFFTHKVSILGIKPVARGGTPSQRIADLVPFSPSGTDPSSFCRLEQGATKLRVTVKNQGNEQAAPSRTTVLFRTVPVTLDTPPIPAGGTVDLVFAVPPGCFSPDCSFTIRADAGNQVSESNEANNAVGGGCVG